ncbi:MAG: NYN domain-containing protein [Gemmataceae bacterium]
MKPHRTGDGERTLAVFIDFENLALGFGNRRDRFSIEKVLERLVEKGKIVAKRAYADWSRFGNFASTLHSAAVELVEIPKRVMTGKNSADIRMVVDAMDLAYSKDHIDTFVVVSGDSDFSPLVSKLKEMGKHVIGLGLHDSTSDLLRDNCDEFIYYEDLDRAPVAPLTAGVAVPDTKKKAFDLLLDSLLALRRENKEVIYSSMVKDTMKRKKPSFNEEYHGYRTFSELLEDAQRVGLIELDKHKASGMYVVTRFGTEPKPASGGTPQPPARPPAQTQPKPPAQPAAKPQPAQPAKPQPQPARQAAPPPARQPEPRQPARSRPPAAPAAKPAPPAKPPKAEEDDRELPLGRSLLDDIDDIDDVPSYRPSKAAPAPKAAPPKAEAKPAKPAAKPAAKPKPATPTAAERRPAAEKPARKSPPPPPAKEPPKKAAPLKPADDDDGFGAGLDD